MMARMLFLFLLIIFSGQSWGLVAPPSNDSYRYDGSRIAENTHNRDYDVIQKLLGDEVRQSLESLSEKPLGGYFFASADGFLVPKKVGSGAENVNAQSALRAKLSGLEKAQQNAATTRQLPDGRTRYYTKEVPARTEGPRVVLRLSLNIILKLVV